MGIIPTPKMKYQYFIDQEEYQCTINKVFEEIEKLSNTGHIKIQNETREQFQ